VATSPEDLLSRLAAILGKELGDELLSLSVHGSWLAGDFKLGRSDLDLLAVLAHDPDERTLARLTGLHRAISAEAPEWDDHVAVSHIEDQAEIALLKYDAGAR
jgi:predicted nucleotidyltransferase